MDWSFSGCGFLGVYHVGVASCLKEYAPHLVNKIYGASGGALAGCCLICNCCLGEAITSLLNIVAKARSRSLGPLHPSFNITKVLKTGLNQVLPNNAHEIASGRLFISLTRVSDTKNIIISEFKSKNDLIQALICSSYIPIYCGIIPPCYQGVRYLDGGMTDNQPIFNEDTITISPFAGETDICPLDASNSFFSFDITNTNIQINTRNIHRLCCALFPPTAEMLSDMCTQGFEDTLRFLQRRSLISCVRCLCLKTRHKKRKDSTLITTTPLPMLEIRNGTDICINNESSLLVPIITPPISSTTPYHYLNTGPNYSPNGGNNRYVPSPTSSNLSIPKKCLAPVSKSKPCCDHSANEFYYAPTMPSPPPPQRKAVRSRHANDKCVECRIPLCTTDLRIYDITNYYASPSHSAYNVTSHPRPATNANPAMSKSGPPVFSTLPSQLDSLNFNLTDSEYMQFKTLPPSISDAFTAACKKMDHGLLNFILKLPPIKLFAYYVYICLFPMDLFLHITLRFLDWIPYLPGDLLWIFGHLVPMIRLVLKKICDQKCESTKASLRCEFSVIREDFYEDYKEAAKASYLDHYQYLDFNGSFM